MISRISRARSNKNNQKTIYLFIFWWRKPFIYDCLYHYCFSPFCSRFLSIWIYNDRNESNPLVVKTHRKTKKRKTNYNRRSQLLLLELHRRVGRIGKLFPLQISRLSSRLQILAAFLWELDKDQFLIIISLDLAFYGGKDSKFCLLLEIRNQEFESSFSLGSLNAFIQQSHVRNCDYSSFAQIWMRLVAGGLKLFRSCEEICRIFGDLYLDMLSCLETFIMVSLI